MPELSQFTMSSGLCSLILLASLGVMVSSQTHDLQVTFAHPPYTTLSIKAQTGCTNTTKDNMIVRLDKCPMKEKQKKFPRTAKGVCQEDGATLCVPRHYRGATCIAVFGEMDGLEYRAEVDVPPNVTFYNGTAPAARNWTQEGNTSKMVVQRLAGVPFYRLVLKPEDSNKGANCKQVTLAGKEESAGSVVFRAHWHQQVFPGCSYKALFQPWDVCGYQLAFDTEVDRLQYVPPKEETVWSGYGYPAALRWWNFQREEQQSVKKPGPSYNKKNTHAFMDPFDQEIVSLVVPREQQHQWSRPFGLWPHEMSFRGLTPLRTFFLFLLSQTPQVIQAQETERGEEDKDEVQDLLLEEKLGEEGAEDIVA